MGGEGGRFIAHVSIECRFFSACMQKVSTEGHAGRGASGFASHG